MRLRSLCAGLVALAGFAAAMAAMPGHTEDKKPYVIYLSNNFVGNDWRQQMERVANVAVNKGPLKGRVDLKIENAEGTVQAQINSLNNIIRQKPAAILIDASSAEALNPTIKKACDAGIVVVSFDQTVSAECAYKLHSDFDIMANNQAEWMASMLGGKGKVLMDRGLAGAPISEQFEKNFGAVLQEISRHRDRRLFQRQLCRRSRTGGRCQPACRASGSRWHLLAGLRHRRHQGAAECRPAAGADRRRRLQWHRRHLRRRPRAPSAGWAPIRLRYRPRRSSSRSTSSTPARSRPTRTVLFNSPGLTTDMVDAKYAPNSSAVKIELGKTVFPDLAPGLSLPVSPSWVEITPKEASGT